MKQCSVIFSGKEHVFNYIVLGGHIGVFTVRDQLRGEPLLDNQAEVEQVRALARKLLANNLLKVIQVTDVPPIPRGCGLEGRERGNGALVSAR